jgi:hypothetical protein
MKEQGAVLGDAARGATVLTSVQRPRVNEGAPNQSIRCALPATLAACSDRSISLNIDIKYTIPARNDFVLITICRSAHPSVLSQNNFSKSYPLTVSGGTKV